MNDRLDQLDDDLPIHLQTRAVRAGRAHNGEALAPVLWASSAFVTPTVADARRSAIEELGVIATDRLGCHARLSRRERDETQRRFSEWLAAHPDALDPSPAP